MSAGRSLRLLVWMARRLAGTALALLGASLLLFAIVRASPGGAPPRLGVMSAPPAASAESPEALPWLTQYRLWLSAAVSGDFGTSAAIQRGRPVSTLLWPAARRSLALAAAAMGFSAAAALTLAGVAMARPFSKTWTGLGWAAHLVSAVPVFLFAYAAVAGGNALVAWGNQHSLWRLPSWFPFPSRDAWFPWLLAAWMLAIGDGLLLDLHQRFSAEIRQASQQDRIAGARLLRLSVPLMVARGFLPGASHHLARRISFVLGSLVVLESALGWPGLGYLAWRGAAERDLPVLLGVALVLALVVRVALLAADGVSYLADPRSRTWA